MTIPTFAPLSPLQQLWRPFRQDRLLHCLLVLLLVLTLWMPGHIAAYPSWVDWHTIITLTGLMLLTKGIETSGFLDHVGRHMLNRFTEERPLALFLVGASALLSTVLTNDIALFIVVPLTLGLRQLAGLPIARLVLFEALAVNIGSLLTPIGNPQNIVLWHQSGLSFWGFTGQMLPLAACLSVVLLMATWWAFPPFNVRIHLIDTEHGWQPSRFWVCVVLYAVFLFLLERGWPLWALAVVVAGLLLLSRRVLLEVDWSLMLVFMLMFVTIHLLTLWPGIAPWLDKVRHASHGATFLTGVFSSQLISNVPATILLVPYSGANIWLAYAVNVGGLGFVLGSLANLIALRMLNEPGMWWQFHRYSLPFLAVGMGLAYGLLQIIG